MKKIIAIILCVLFCFTVFLPLRLSAHADALTFGTLAASSFAIANTVGASWRNWPTFTSDQWNDVMVGELQNYCGERTIVETFGNQIIRDVAGKIVVGAVTYNKILDFLTWLKQKYNMGTRTQMGLFIDGEYSALQGPGAQFLNGWSLNVYDQGPNTYWVRRWDGPEGQTRSTGYNNVLNNQYPAYTIKYYTAKNGITGSVTFQSNTGAVQVRDDTIPFSVLYQTVDIKRPYGEITGDPSVLPVISTNQAWSGDITSYEGPDTNLDQLMDGILDGVADNNLQVEGEIIDVDPPQPVPTPAPGIDEIIGGLDDANDTLTGIDTNLDDLYAQGLEEIGTIGEARDAITDAVSDQTGVLEGAIADNAGVVSGAIDQAVSDVGTAIGTQTGLISGAIDQAVSDVQTAIGEQTAALDESLSATAEGVETIAEAIEDEEINWQKFDLKGLFPFCIPFDIYNMLKALDASPTAPHVQIPFVIQSIGFSYTLDLDFSAFDSVAAIMRQMELICYGLALAWATSKVIKW